jgi:tRNA pseudouridine55 synthase
MKTDLVVGYKKRGQTPLALIEDLKREIPELITTSIGYAGRLDPMAEGLVLLLLNDKNKERARFEKIKKEYESEILFGVETDTFDALGLAVEKQYVKISEDMLHKTLKPLVGKHDHQYPPFSSPLVQGKPLWQWAKEGRISEVQIPSKLIEIYKTELLELVEKSAKDIQELIVKKISEIVGDFRQKEIIASWKSFFNTRKENFQVATVLFDVSSGTYIRTLAHDLGRINNTGAIALSIKRTQLGNVGIDTKQRFKFVNEEDLFS